MNRQSYHISVPRHDRWSVGAKPNSLTTKQGFPEIEYDTRYSNTFKLEFLIIYKVNLFIS